MQYYVMNKNDARSRMTDRLPHKLYTPYINTGPCNDETLIMPIGEAFFLQPTRRCPPILYIIIYHNIISYTL